MCENVDVAFIKPSSGRSNCMFEVALGGKSIYM